MAGVKGQMRRNPTQGARARAWQSMRMLRVFDIAQIMATAEIPRQNASKFLVALERTGFIQRTRDHVSGRPGSFITYRIARDTGPHAPAVQMTGQVLDVNTGALYAPESGEKA